MVCEVDQLVLAFFAETINCTGTHRVANLAGGMFAICEHFDDNGILSINFFSTHTTAPMCAHKTEPLPCPHLLLFSWLFSTLTHTHKHIDTQICAFVWVWHLDRRFSLLSGCFLTCCRCQCKLSCLLFRSTYKTLFIYLPARATATNLCDVKLNSTSLALWYTMLVIWNNSFN